MKHNMQCDCLYATIIVFRNTKYKNVTCPVPVMCAFVYYSVPKKILPKIKL